MPSISTKRELVYDPRVITSSTTSNTFGVVDVETEPIRGKFERVKHLDGYTWRLITMLEKNVDRFTPLYGDGVLIREGKLPASPTPKHAKRP